MNPYLLKDVWTLADNAEALPWQPFRPGVDIYRLYGTEEGAASALLRYQPGAEVPHHEHTGYENILVLSGSQEDERGVYAAGTFVVNPPGSEHVVRSPEGCLVLIIWEKPVAIRHEVPVSES